MKIRWFEHTHPLVLFVYLLGVMGVCLGSLHPWYVAGSFTMALGVNLWLRGAKQTARTLRHALWVFCIVALANPLFNGRGATILFELFETPITLEALCYGVCSGGMLMAMWLWCAIWQSWMTAERFLYLFGNAVPTLSLMISMIWGLLPQSAQKLRQIRLAQPMEKQRGKREKARSLMRQITALVVMDMEDSMQTADAMRCKGYGVQKRTTFSVFRFTGQDGVLLALEIVLAGLCIAGLIQANRGLVFYPYLAAETPNAALYGCMAAFMLLPLGVQGKEEWQCKRSA